MKKSTMHAISVSVTAGENSEMHDHNLEYRAKLEHVIHPEQGLVEFAPYTKPYRETINEFAQPFIENYIRRREEGLEAAMLRFEAGEIKQKPRLRPVKLLETDYYTYLSEKEHTNPKTKKKEKGKPYRSLIIGLGDREDRLSGRITVEQANAIGKDLYETFKTRFDKFLMLGFVLHLEEGGCFHIHISFLPIHFDTKKGLAFGTGFDEALRAAGLKEERSLFSPAVVSAKVFDAFRNWFYRTLERILPEHGLLLDFGVTARKSPWMPSDVRVTQETWKEIQDTFIRMNELCNEAKQTFESPTFGDKDIQTVAAVNNTLNNLLAQMQGRTRMFGKDEYHLNAEQYEELWRAFEKEREVSQLLLYKTQAFYERFRELENLNAELSADIAALERDNYILKTHLRQRGQDATLPELERY